MVIKKVIGYSLSSTYGDGNVFGQPEGVKSIGLVEVHTDDGLVGIGETYSGVYVPELIEPTVKFLESLVVGLNPLNIEGVYDTMEIPFVGRDGFIRSVIGAIEIALWDIKGQVESKPIYQLLGDDTHEFDVYSSGGSVTFDCDMIKKDIENIPFDSYKMRVGFWDWWEDIQRVKIAREELGSNELMVDSIMGTLNTWDRHSAVLNINDLSEENLTWIEEPLHPSKLKDLKYVYNNIKTPIATGEGLSGKLDFDSYLDSGCIDIIQPDVTHCGGYIRAKKIIKQAKEREIKVALHVWGSSISLMSALHLAIATGVDWLEVPNVKLDLLSDRFNDIVSKISTKNYDLGNGLGIKVDNKIKNDYVFIPNSGYKI